MKKIIFILLLAGAGIWWYIAGTNAEGDATKDKNDHLRYAKIVKGPFRITIFESGTIQNLKTYQLKVPRVWWWGYQHASAQTKRASRSGPFSCINGTATHFSHCRSPAQRTRRVDGSPWLIFGPGMTLI